MICFIVSLWIHFSQYTGLVFTSTYISLFLCYIYSKQMEGAEHQTIINHFYSPNHVFSSTLLVFVTYGETCYGCCLAFSVCPINKSLWFLIMKVVNETQFAKTNPLYRYTCHYVQDSPFQYILLATQTHPSSAILYTYFTVVFKCSSSFGQ